MRRIELADMHFLIDKAEFRMEDHKRNEGKREKNWEQQIVVQ
jgi:hypothetical protein